MVSQESSHDGHSKPPGKKLSGWALSRKGIKETRSRTSGSDGKIKRDGDRSGEGWEAKLPKDPATVAAQSIFLSELLSELAALDLEPVALAAKRAIEKARLASLFGSEKIELVEDADGEGYQFKMEIPPMVTYDEKEGKIRCENAAIARLIQITTNGDKHAIKKLLSDRSNFKARLLEDKYGWIKLSILANAVVRALKPDPRNKATDWAKLALQIIEEEKNAKKDSKRGQSAEAYKGLDAGDRATSELEGFLRRVEGEGHPGGIEEGIEHGGD